MEHEEDHNADECIAKAHAAFAPFLKKRGLSFTKARKDALSVIFSFDSHFDLEELKERFSETEVSFHTTSIFRLIALLVEAGMLEKIKTNAHRKVAYECTLCSHHHDHMVCNVCGNIYEFYNEDLEKIQTKVAEEFGFKILYHNLTITGECMDCQKRNLLQSRNAPSNVVRFIPQNSEN